MAHQGSLTSKQKRQIFEQTLLGVRDAEGDGGAVSLTAQISTSQDTLSAEPFDFQEDPVTTTPTTVTTNNISQAELEPTVEKLDGELSNNYKNYLATNTNTLPEVTIEQPQGILQNIESAVNAKPALIYSFFSQRTNKLKLVLVLHPI